MAACAPYIQGPPIRDTPTIVSVSVELLDAYRPPSVVRDQRSIELALAVLSPEGWVENDGDLIPTYRLILTRDDSTTLIYWIGTFSDPPRFPCYWFCSGFWAGSSTPDGDLRRDLIKPLATGGDKLAVSDLLNATSAEGTAN
jgi:hypothetical protein